MSYNTHVPHNLPPPVPLANAGEILPVNTAFPPPRLENYYAYPPPPIAVPSTASVPTYYSQPPPPVPHVVPPPKMVSAAVRMEQPPPPADDANIYHKMYTAPPPPPPPRTASANAPAPIAVPPSTHYARSSYNYAYGNYYDSYYNTDYGNYNQSCYAEQPTRYKQFYGSKPDYYKYTHNNYVRQNRPTTPASSFKTTENDSYDAAKRSYRERDAKRLKVEHKPETERDRLLKSWRSNYCETPEDIAKKLSDLAKEDVNAPKVWSRSSPADLFYRRTDKLNEVVATPRLEALCKLFDEELIERAARVRKTLPPYEPPPRKPKRRVCKHKLEACSSSSDSEHDEDELKIEQDYCMEELSRKLQHPYRVHSDLWHNDPGEMNDGPLCRCSAKSKRIGIRHGIYPGEDLYEKCAPLSNNSNRLHHYAISISPPTNFLTKTPTLIKHDEHEFLFEGFSLLSHLPLGDLPTCKVIRFNIEYTISYTEEKMPENFTINELDLFTKYLFHELLELVDFSLLPHDKTADETCPAFHFLPRFVRDLPDNGKEVLAMSEVLKYLLDNAAPLVDSEHLHCLNDISQYEWQDYVDYLKGMLVTKPGYKPCSLRVDQLDRNASDLPECYDNELKVMHPAIVHFGIRPPQLSYAGNPEYQKAWREYVKFRHLMANMSKPSFKDKRKLEEKEARLQEMRTQGRMKRNITVAVSSKGYYRTGIMCDIVQHAMLLPVLSVHLRFHKALDLLEKNVNYKFKNRYLLQLALTHPSYKENYGTNPDHARNSLTNCGIRQPEYGDRNIHYMNARKRGINTLINIMSRFGKEYDTMSNITHNERLEFLGDAVVEFLSSIHLFFMFPELEEGGLATYRAAIVQNQHLALLARKLHLEQFMLYAHGSDLCHELELRHAMANCFEALMGALLLDGGITIADNVFMNALFMEDDHLREIWCNYPEHPLQEQEPLGDRSCIASYPVLKQLTLFEDAIGIKFKHIRLLARAFTDRSIGFTHLTLGSNQRLEFLGDTVLQLICSEYLYRHFPEHHEGHLSLLRSSLVNNRTQAVVCDDLGMTKYAVYSNPKAELKTKDRADLLEAFLGALYVDKGLLYCEQFCHVCLFPRLQMFIMNQDWNDPKSKLQQCCLTLRTMDGGEPDIPIYKVIESIGPTNTRVYTVAVYFRSKRLATATGASIQQAEMNAATQALENSRELFPQLDHQKRVIAKSIKKQSGGELRPEVEQLLKDKQKPKNFAPMEDESHLPKQYRIREDISSDELSDVSDDYNSDTQQNFNLVHTRRRKASSEKSSISSYSSSTSDSEFATSADTPSPRCSRLRRNNRRSQTISPKEYQHDTSVTVDKIQTNCEEVSSEEAEMNNAESVGKNCSLPDLQDLVEDVSSKESEVESGELST